MGRLFWPKQLAVARRGTVNPVRHKPNGRERGRTVCVNLPATDDRRIRLYQASGIRALADVGKPGGVTIWPYPHRRKILTQMGFVKYHSDITKFLLKMENLNMQVRVTGIAWRKIIEE